MRIGSCDRGYTLIEALAALAVVVAGLAAIGQLGFSTLAAARRTEARLALASAAREALAALPEDRAASGPALTGQIDGKSWRLLTSPFPFAASGAPYRSVWSPEAARLLVAGPGGGRIVIDTIRLRPSGAAR